MNIYDEAIELLEPIDLALDMMKKFIQPAIFEGLKSNIEALKYLIKNQEERAKKVEELLGLYRYLNENTNDYDLNPDEVDEIHNKIYELEEEMK